MLELSTQIDGSEGQFVLSEKNKELDLAKKAELIFDPLTVDINERKILNKLYMELSDLSKGEEMYIKTVELLRHLQEYMLELEQCTEYILEFDQETDMSALLKAANIRYGFYGTSGSIHESLSGNGWNKDIYICKSSKLSDRSSDAGNNKRNEVSEYKRFIHRESTKGLHGRGETVYYRCRQM